MAVTGNQPYHLLIVIPAKDEQLNIEACLTHMLLSRAQLATQLQRQTHIVVVCDACTDATAMLANSLLCPVRDAVISCNFGNVGRARALGAQVAWQMVQHDAMPNAAWYAFTDADTCVPIDWLAQHLMHLRSDSHAALGIVQIDRLDPAVRNNFELAYLKKMHGAGHFHIHGANMGVRADRYWAVGGFPALTAHEDRELVKRLLAAGARILRDRHLVVTTSGRMHGRAPAGFAQDLRRLQSSQREHKAEFS